MTTRNPEHPESRTSVYLCIGCPLGCRLEVEERVAPSDPTADSAGAGEGHEQGAGEIVEVRGFACKRGEEYARQEHRSPQRTVTATVAISGARWARLPVRSAGPVPKDLVLPICRRLARVQVAAPVKLGQTLVADVLGTGVDIVAARSMGD
jgi:CxxC motif-containing protein